MFKQIHKEQYIKETLDELVGESLVNLHQNQQLNETHENLKAVIKKVLVTNKVIPTPLATTIAKIILYSQMLKDLVDRKRRYKKHSLLTKVYDHITDVAAKQLEPATAENKDNVRVDIMSIAKEIVDSLHGKPESLDDVQRSFEAIFNKLTTNTSERNRLSIMKLASKIVQSNDDVQTRREIIKQYLDS